MKLGRPRLGSDVICEECGEEFYLPPSRIKRGDKHCSLACRDASNRRQIYDDSSQLKKCAKCNEWKPFEFFRTHKGTKKSSKNTLQSYCNSCSSKTNEKWRLENRPNKNKARLTKREKLDRKLAWNRKRVSEKRASGKFPSHVVLEALCCHQDWRCTYCGHHLTSRHLDHIVPVSRGGTNDIENLQWLCPTCNLRKGTLSSERFIARNGAFGRASECLPESFDVEAFVSAVKADDFPAALAVIERAKK